MRYLLTALLLLLSLYFAWQTWFGERGSRALRRGEEEIVATREHIEVLEAENQRLARRIWLLQNDSRYQELTVRRELKLVREDEIIFVFERSPKAGGPFFTGRQE